MIENKNRKTMLFPWQQVNIWLLIKNSPKCLSQGYTVTYHACTLLAGIHVRHEGRHVLVNHTLVQTVQTFRAAAIVSGWVAALRLTLLTETLHTPTLKHYTSMNGPLFNNERANQLCLLHIKYIETIIQATVPYRFYNLSVRILLFPEGV